MRKSEGKLQLEVKNLSKYADIKDMENLYSEQVTYINNFPIKVCVEMDRDEETNETHIGFFVDSGTIKKVTFAE